MLNFNVSFTPGTTGAAHTSDVGAAVNISNPIRYAQVEAAIASSYTLPLLKTPVHALKDYIFDVLKRVVRYTTYLSARAWYHALRSVLNNSLTRRITPSVTSLDSKVEHLCNTAGRYTANALAFPITLSFYLIASAYALAISALVIPLYTVVSAVLLALSLTKGALVDFYKMVVENTREDFSKRESSGSTVPLLLGIALARVVSYTFLASLLYGVGGTLYKVLATLCSPLLSPVYTLSSLFERNNRFNIYDFDNKVGTVHSFVNDMKRSDYVLPKLILDIQGNRLKNEAHNNRGVSAFLGSLNDLPQQNPGALSSQDAAAHNGTPSGDPVAPAGNPVAPSTALADATTVASHNPVQDTSR